MKILYSALAFTLLSVSDAAKPNLPEKSDFDCSEGCDLKGPRVCGTDGTTYRNACIAVCQDVTLEKMGSCPGAPLRNPNGADEDGRVDLATMKKFEGEKFKFVGKRKFIPLDASFQFDDQAVDDDGEDTEDLPGKIRATRVSEEGYEYEAIYDSEDWEGEGEDIPPFDPEPETDYYEEETEDGGVRRYLKVIGTDTRYKECSTCKFVNRITGELDYDWNQNGIFGEKGGCSGTVVSKDSVLTAGHCVYDFNNRKDWMPHSRFAPARYRSSSGTQYQPYGYFYWRTMTTYQGWTRDGKRKYDMAVIKYWPTSGLLPGERVGYAGWSSVSNGDDSKLDSAHIKGYPGDKPDGTMWNTGTCNHWCYSKTLWWCSEDLLSKHTCDTYGGMSGSSAMSTSGYVYGVHVAGSSSYNVAVLLHGIHVTKFKEWAGR